MRRRVHATAGIVGFLLIAVFWTSTAASELFGLPEAVAAVKTGIVWAMLALVPALAIAGASGMAMGRRRSDALALAKKRRMPVIALNGLIVLVPSALFLADRANAGTFDAWFYGMQAVELTAGAVNLTLIGRNIRDGLRMTDRLGRYDAMPIR